MGLKTICLLSRKKIIIGSGVALFAYKNYGGSTITHTLSTSYSKTVLEWFIYIAGVCGWNNTGNSMFDNEFSQFIAATNQPAELNIRQEELARAIGFIDINETFSIGKIVAAVNGVLTLPFYGTYKAVLQNCFYNGFGNKHPSYLGTVKTKITTNTKTVTTNLGTFNNFDEDFILWTYEINVHWFPEFYMSHFNRFLNTHCKNGLSEQFNIYNLFFKSHIKVFELLLDIYEPEDDIPQKRLMKFSIKLKEIQ